MAESQESGKKNDKGRAKRSAKSRAKPTEERSQQVEAASPQRATETSGEVELAELVARGFVARTAWRGRLVHDGEPAAGAEAARAVVPLPALSPVQAVIDRTVPPEIFYRDTPIEVNGNVVVILRRDAGFPSGPLPHDPGQTPPQFDPRLAVCHVLSPLAAARCARGASYF